MAALLAAGLAGCAALSSSLKAEREAEEARRAALRRIVVVSGSTVPGRTSLVRLGRVQGWCDDDIARQESSVPSETLREAAYRRFGDEVGAIIEVNTWFVVDDTASAVWAIEGGGGHWECSGEAVKFEAAPADPMSDGSQQRRNMS
jgi:hypothetical protein